jgi:large subunit ribosomal protein L4e
VRKKIEKRIPQKEMRLALHSAVAATAHKGTVTSRGHITENIPNFPLVITDEIQSLIKTREVREAFINLGLWPDVDRVKKRRKVRAGKGKGRGRKMKNAVGPLLVIGKDEGLAKAAKNVPGVDVVTVESLNVELLAPGTHPGRLTVWTSSAIEKINEMFLEM